MNDMTAQIAEETTRENEISEAMANAAQAISNITMIKVLADYAVEALADRGTNIARIRLGEIVTYTRETIAMLTPNEY